MRNLLSATSVACLLLAPMSLSAMAAEAWRTDGLSTPESVVYDEANQRLIVSNIIGEATEADGKGSLSTIALDGTMIDANWVEGLDAPKGSAIAGGKLYVADISNIRVVDLASGAVETIAVDGATFLNDVTAGDDGAVYVTDTFANRIYRVADGAAALFLEDAALGSPNGILFDQGALVVAGFGQLAEKQEDMVPGGLVSVDIASKAITPMAEKVGFLDGIDRFDEALVVSDFFGGKIISIAADGTQTTLAELGMGTADIGTDGTAIYVPLMMQNQVVKLEIE